MTGVGRRSTAGQRRIDVDGRALDAAFAVVWDHLVDGGSDARAPVGRVDLSLERVHTDRLPMR